jgi:superfamily II DNA or RNA helicase
MKQQVIIELNNVKSTVLNASGQIYTSLYNKLSCYAPQYWFARSFKNGRWDGKQRFFNRKEKSFPTGLLQEVIDALNEWEVEVKTVDKRTGMVKFPNLATEEIVLSSGKTLRNYQVDAVKSVINNTYCGLPFQRGIINIATNGGKTVIAEALLDDIYDKIPDNKCILFVTHSKEIAFQAKNSFENDLGIDVGFIGDGKWNCKRVTIALISTLYSRMKKNSPEYQKLVKSTIGFIGDEIHHSSSTSWYEVLETFTSASIRLGLTGTVENEDEVKRLRLKSVCGDILVKISNEFLIQNGFSAKPECRLFRIDYPDIDNHMRYFGQDGEAGQLSYSDTYQKGIVMNDYRNWIIAKLCEREFNSNHQVLVLVEHLEHGASIEKFLDVINPEIKHLFLYGELKSEERQTGLQLLKSGDVDVIISTSILDEGVDVPNINSVIYARGGKSTRKILQGIGRGLRKKDDESALKFYDFMDYTSQYLLEHSLNRYKVLKKENFEIKKLSLEDDLGITESVKQEFLDKYDTAFDEEVFVYVDEE